MHRSNKMEIRDIFLFFFFFEENSIQRQEIYFAKCLEIFSKSNVFSNRSSRAGKIARWIFFVGQENAYAENSFIAGRMARDERASFDSREISGQRDGAGIAGCTGDRKWGREWRHRVQCRSFNPRGQTGSPGQLSPHSNRGNDTRLEENSLKTDSNF